ncbi:hypothetical protein LTR39_000939 [Cryomyces antarcticus]|nr:hypothetical protein LTR39_000939 [Cryomyces antarcticus]
MSSATPQLSVGSSENEYKEDRSHAAEVEVDHVHWTEDDTESIGDIEHRLAASAKMQYVPGGPLLQDWDSLDLGELSSAFEPQGELVGELQNQVPLGYDFDMPGPVQLGGDMNYHHQNTEDASLFGTSTSVATGRLRPNPLQPEPENHAGSKRRFDHEPPSVTPAAQIPLREPREPPNKRQSKSTSSSIASVASSNPHPPPRYYPAAAMSGPSKASRSKNIPENPPASNSSRRNVNRSSVEPPLAERSRTVHTGSGSIDMVLPAGKVFPIQIGSELFRLSGASISSDADKAKLPVTRLSGSSADSVRVRLGPEADITLDGVKYLPGDVQANTAPRVEGSGEEGDRSVRRRYSKRKRGAGNDGKSEKNVSKASEWVVRKGHWRLCLQPAVDAAAAASSSGGSGMEVVLHAVKLEAFSSERARNAQTAFLC